MDGLHEDILTEILLRVPASSLARLKWASKRWHALITHPTFVKLHLESSKEDPASRKILKIDTDYKRGTPVKFGCIDSENLERESRLHVPTGSFLPIVRAVIKGTCDGLVCLHLLGDCGDKSCGTRHRMICLWNPSTREFRQLPNLDNCSLVALRLGCVADDYKVVAFANQGDLPMTQVHIWARKTSTWERIPDIPVMDYVVGGPSICLKGAVHWVARRRIDGVSSHVILSFCFSKDEVQELPIPKAFSSIRKCPNVGILNGCLCVYTGGRSSIKSRVEAWIMKDYGVETSWARLFKISRQKLPDRLLGSLKVLTLRNGKILLVLGYEYGPTPFLYDLEEKTLHGFPDIPRWRRSGLLVYEESLVSPYSCVDGCKLEEVVTSPSSGPWEGENCICGLSRFSCR